MKKLLPTLALAMLPFLGFSQCFDNPIDLPVGDQVRAVAKGDFNSDGHIDLATANKLLTGNGNAGFTTTTISNLDNNVITSIVSADFNGDGKTDLAMSGGDVFLLIGNGTGGFSPPVTITLGTTYVKRIVNADFNADGKMDLVAIGDTVIKILLGNGIGGFSNTTVTTLTGNPLFMSLATADFNLDGKKDLAVLKNVASGIGYLCIFLGNGAGGFNSQADQMIGGYPSAITTGDFNNDGNMDIATSHHNPVTIALGNGSGGFSINIMNSEVNSGFITNADFNNDGALDLVLCYSFVNASRILSGDGLGDFPPNDSYAIFHENALCAVVADFNEDERIDLATANYYSGTISVLLSIISVTTAQTEMSTCFGGDDGTATATATCGTNFSYSWNTTPVQTSATATGLQAGTYIVTVTEGNASVTSSVTIYEPSEIVINASAVNESCNGGGQNGSATSNTSGGTPPYQYLWNTTPVQTTQTATNLTAGNYNVTVTDANGCNKSSNVQVNYTANPSSFSYATNGMVASFTRTGSGCNNFVWDFGNGNTSTLNPNPTVTYLAAGTYGVCLQCNSQPTECVQCLNITVPSNTTGGTLGIATVQTSAGIKVYPNPANDLLTINNKNFKYHSGYMIFNTMGQPVLKGSVTDETTAINVDALSSGVYLLQVGETEKQRFKFIKK